MSLKENSKPIFTDYGLNDQEIKILLAYLSTPQATVSMIAGLLELDYDLVKETTAKLVEAKLIREIPGKITRYVPLEPYFSLFIKQSENFRTGIEKIKDAVLQDQSKRFKELENIQNGAISEVDTAVKNQVDEFFRVSDEHDADKKQVIDTANSRFTTEAKQLESDIHGRIETDYEDLNSDVRQMESDAVKVWDENSAKFTNDNNELNGNLDQISDAHVGQTNALEQNLHGIIDGLNGQLKTIADGFVQKYEEGINSAKDGINNIIADLLKDFADRVNKLENEMKRDLDEHVEKHKENAQALKPSLEEILAKYMDRMHNVVEELKKLISKLLLEHVDHMKSTTDKMDSQLKNRVDERQDELVGQVKSFEDNTVVLIDNLAEISENFTNLGETLASRGSAFKALFLGRHKDWVALNDDIQNRVADLSGSMKTDFTASTSDYIAETEQTKESLKGEIDKILSNENQGLKSETETLDNKAQSTVNAELEGLASDLSQEIDSTLKENIAHCKDTTVKLKDSIQSSFSTHKGDYDAAINRHNKKTLDHYGDCDRDVKNKVDGWYSEMDKDHQKAKNDITTEKDSQIKDINDHREKTKSKNVEHSKTFEQDTESVKNKQNEIYTNRLEKIRGDFDASKQETSQKIDGEIEQFSKECKETDDKLHAMLEEHKSKYKENATTLQQSLTNTISENTKDTRDAIADFTLEFINSIDEANEIADQNEDKLNDIFEASQSVVETAETNTWHVIGLDAIIEAVADSLTRVKSSVIVITHEVIPKVLELMSETAFNRKSARIMYTTHWTPEYEPILAKMKGLGNIQFRQLKSRGEFIAMTKDAEEVILAPISRDEENIIAIVSEDDGYCKLYSQIIGPVFQANSRPV